MKNLASPGGRFYPVPKMGPDAYQATLPGIAPKPDTPLKLLEPVPELAEIDERQCVLCPGILNVRTWRRGERAWIPWHDIGDRPGLESRLQAIDTHRGRSWTEGDLKTMAQVEVQTWNAADLGNVRIALPTWLRCDGLRSPIDGQYIHFPKKPGHRAVLQIAWCGAMAGTGGVRMSLPQWAAELGVCTKTVQRYFNKLEALGLIRKVQLWRPPAWSHKGSRKDVLLIRIGAVLEPLALAEIVKRASKNGAGIIRPIDQQKAERLESELKARGKRRRFDVAGAVYDQIQGWGRVRGVGFSIIPSNETQSPNSPPQGVTVHRPPPSVSGAAKFRGSAPVEGSRDARESLAVPTTEPTTPAGAPPWPPQPTQIRPNIRLEGEAFPASGPFSSSLTAARLASALGFAVHSGQ